LTTFGASLAIAASSLRLDACEQPDEVLRRWLLDALIIGEISSIGNKQNDYTENDKISSHCWAEWAFIEDKNWLVRPGTEDNLNPDGFENVRLFLADVERCIDSLRERLSGKDEKDIAVSITESERLSQVQGPVEDPAKVLVIKALLAYDKIPRGRKKLLRDISKKIDLVFSLSTLDRAIADVKKIKKQSAS
jgi:hypothetical protein